MNKKIKYLLVILFLTAGCATPAQVKQLSVKQSEYFDAAIEAIILQSEALIIATEKLANIAKSNIDHANEESHNLFVDIIFDTGNRDSINTTLEMMSTNTEEVRSAKANINNDVMLIKMKTEELLAYITKMKEVHTALDAYIQSEKAGEIVVKDVLNQPSVNALLEMTNELIPKVTSGITDVSDLLNQMGE